MKAPVLATQLMGVRENTVDYVFVDPPAKTEQQRKSERAQEGQELFLLLLPQIGEPALRIGRLAAVAENGVPQGQRLPVVHEPTSSPPPPERRRPKPGSGDLVLRLHVHE